MRRLVPVLAVAAAGCGESRGVGAVLRDSAAVQIAENHASALDWVPTWSLSQTPQFEIGTPGAEPGLHQVQDAIRLPDRRIVVANAGNFELLVFDPEGRFLHAIGGKGEGPGEFLVPSSVWAIDADTLLVWDLRLQRASLFTTSGLHLRDITIRGRPLLGPIGLLKDRTLIMHDHGSPVRPEDGSLLRYDLRGRLLESLGPYPAHETATVRDAGGRRVQVSPHLAGGPIGVGGHRGYWIGPNDAYEVRNYDASGDLVQIIRWEGPERTVTPEVQERYRQYRLGGARDPKQARASLDATPFATQLPAYWHLLVDTASYLWVQLYHPPWQRGPARWLVFDPDGRLVARSEMPRRFWVYEIGEDYALGVFRDELDIERVRLYALERR